MATVYIPDEEVQVLLDSLEYVLDHCQGALIGLTREGVAEEEILQSQLMFRVMALTKLQEKLMKVWEDNER